MNIRDEIDKIMADGYNEANAEARLCQDVIMSAIANSNLNRNVTIKGGVVMRNLSKNTRRATQDIDFDFIRYSVSDEAIKLFVKQIDSVSELMLQMNRPIKKLKHQDYDGKRIFIDISDDYGNKIEGKLDIGVHKDLDIEQEEYCFDICFQKDGVSLLMNSKEQMVTEKVKSLLRFGPRSTRYKDVFDICYLITYVDSKKLKKCMKKYIYEDSSLNVNQIEDVIMRLDVLFQNKTFVEEIKKSKKNWLDITVEETLKQDFDFFQRMLASQ